MCSFPEARGGARRRFNTIFRPPRSVLTYSIVGMCLVGPGLVAAQPPSEIDSLTQRWLDTERQASSLAADWLDQKPVLEQRIALLQAEKRELQQALALSSESQDSVEDRRAELVSEQADLESQQAVLQQSITGLLARLEAIKTYLPEPLLRAWEDEGAVLTDEADASLKLQVALAQLSRLAEFNGRIGVHETAVDAPDGKTVVVKQLYLGVGASWFVSVDGAYAGVGYAGSEGWQWQFMESLDAEDIANAIAMFEKRTEADLVSLPYLATHSLGVPAP